MTTQVVTARTCHACALASEGQCLAYGVELECDEAGAELRCQMCLDAYPRDVLRSAVVRLLEAYASGSPERISLAVVFAMDALRAYGPEAQP